MRAIAVLTVFANHLFDWPSGGFIGVDVFFVLSGFFITGILVKERTKRRKLSFKNFYIRRVKRILPSALLVLVATVVGAHYLFPAARAKETLLDALYAAIFGANIRFEAVGTDYFQENMPPSPLQHYWSLSIEEQFYFVWPALLVVIFGLTRGFRRTGKGWARHLALFTAMAGIVATSFVWAMHLSASDPNQAYFSTFTRVWELGVGALLAIAGAWLVRIPAAVRPVLAYLGLAGVAASLFVIDPTVQFPAPWAALPVLSTALVVASFHGVEVRRMPLLTNRVARYFGDTSYTLYLWHWPVIILLVSVLPRGPLYIGAAIAISLGLTALTYRFYEDPIRKSDWLLDKADESRRNVFLTWGRPVWTTIGAFAAAVIVLSILGIQHADKNSVVQNELTGAQEESQLAFASPHDEKVNPCFGAPAMLNPNCKLRNPDVALLPSVDNFAKDEPRELDRCFTPKAAKLRTCSFGYDGADAKRIALVGDSKGIFLLPALQKVLHSNKWNLTTYLGKACALMIPAKDECQESMGEAEKQLLAHPYDLVIFANISYGVEQQALRHQKAMEPLVRAGSRLAVVADNAVSSEEAIACLTRVTIGGDRTGECATPRSEAFPKPDTLVAAAQIVPGTTVIDLTPYYCNADRCPAVIGDVIVHYDATHISATYSRTLWQPIEEGVLRALGTPVNAPR
ncbi:Peptidoglycan/LPS O-acetylase OafA/YrhL, contains acyltransferase and SGNH-hydrolase domains [Mycolicibacterium fluoranthenivorans]|uniref:Peptidoglycan/LPS O-acetylase OafA/YrhL, contains acyltransferase and SGNH-hydrolase domains n=2 Tax=Mycolicibacterium fluoranthenivorans TaxID=258505 RepID=A0A1G4WVH5_9MYCO|nr:Peptidoglycan/LPS O-acetylase OafA/YrhL, contains acyltransferase and SGNH-hydrolase domains [Mycolicibacterium fluoranthenivorans]